MAERYNWTPEQVNAMTPAQTALLLRPEGGGGLERGPDGKLVKRFKSVDEALKFQQQVRQKS